MVFTEPGVIKTRTMRFLSILRERDANIRLAPDPMEPGFDEGEFNKCYLAHHDGSPEDYSTVLFGALTGRRVRRIFDTLEDLKSRVRRCSYDEIAVAVAEFLEIQQQSLFAEYLTSFEAKAHITAEALHSHRSAVDARGNMFTAQEVMEALVDGVRHILRAARDGNGFGEARGDAEINDLRSIVGQGIRLGGAFESLRTQWHAVLWSSGRVTVDLRPPHNYVIDKRKTPLASLSLIDIQRRQAALSRDKEATEVRRFPLTVFARKILRLQPQGPDGGTKIVVVTIGALPPRERNLAIETAALYQGFVDPQVEFFLAASPPSLKGLPYRSAVDALFCIALLTLQTELDDESADNASSNGVGSIRLDAYELKNALSKALDVRPDQAKALIAFFTYLGRHHTLWARPLLATASGLLPLKWPLQGAHIMRLVSEWGKLDSGGDLIFSDKGHRYEEVVSRVLDGVSRHPRAGIRCIPFQHRLKVPGKADDGNDVGDVDCAFIVDQTLFLLECRAVSHPAEAFEFWSVQENLNAKVEQVLRKKRYVETHLEVISSWRRQDGLPTPTNISRVVPIVVSNSFLLEGERKEQPWFVHLDTLFNLLLTGGSLFGLGFDEQDREIGVLVDKRKRAGSDADAIIESLRNPAKAEAFKATLTDHETVIPGMDDTDAHATILEKVLRFPEDPDGLKQLLGQCSFADCMSPVIFGR